MIGIIHSIDGCTYTDPLQELTVCSANLTIKIEQTVIQIAQTSKITQCMFILNLI